MGIIRDQQRKLSEEFNDVIVLPTVGSTHTDRSKDGCHYTDEGYAKIGENMAPLVLKHLYQFNIEDKYIMGPSIEKIYYSNKHEICLEFNMDIIAQVAQSYTFQNEGVAYLTDYFYREGNIPLKPVSMSVKKNKLYLTTPDTLPAKALTYLPNIFTNIPSSYTGPWILNKNNENLGALSFYEFPMEIYPNDFWFNDTDYLQVFPNPVTDYLSVRKRKNIALYQLELYNALGNLVLNAPIDGDNTIIIDMRAYESGVYFLKTKNSEGTSHTKIILERGR
jgi:hypothetical protein